MWFYIALVTSFLSAISVILTKHLLKNIKTEVVLWSLYTFAIPYIFIFVLIKGIPKINDLFVFGVIGSAFIFCLAKWLEFKAIKNAELSQIYPLIAFTPIVTLFLAWSPILNEQISKTSIIGLIITLIGLFLFNKKKNFSMVQSMKFIFIKKPARYIFIGSLVKGSVIIFDKLAINNTIPENSAFVLLIEDILISFGFFIYFIIKRENILLNIKNNFFQFIIFGILNAIHNIIAFSAIAGGSVAIIETILKMNIIFVLLLSLIFYKDKFKVQSLISAVVIVIGIVIMKLGLN